MARDWDLLRFLLGGFCWGDVLLMKWFKHISDSLDDPFIFDLIDRFGADGYLVFFGILEIYSREFKSKDDWKLSVTRSQLRAKFHKRQDTLIIKSLKHIQNSGKWEIEIKDSQVIIFIPKFKELIDEWTKRKLRSGSVVAPKKHKLNKNKEVRSKNKEKDIQYPGWLNLNLWNDFKKHRNGMKPKLSLHAETLNINKLAKLVDRGFDQTEIINQTIERGWKGLFEPKESFNGKNEYKLF